MSRYLSIVIFLTLTGYGCGPQKTTRTASSQSPETTSPRAEKTDSAPVQALEAEPTSAVEDIPPPPEPNADFQATFVFADGTTKNGKVIRIERGSDWYAEDGWVDSTSKLTLSLESGDTAEDVTWQQVGSIDIRYGRASDVDCQYDSTFNPWMYMCVLKSTPTIRTADGKSWTTTARHKWKFTFADDSEVAFYLYKLPNREQDTEEVGFGDSDRQNFDLYKKLQDGLMQQVKTKALTKLKISDAQ